MPPPESADEPNLRRAAVAQMLRRARDKARLTQQALAEAVGQQHQSYPSKIERCIQKVEIFEIEAWLLACGRRFLWTDCAIDAGTDAVREVSRDERVLLDLAARLDSKQRVQLLQLAAFLSDLEGRDRDRLGHEIVLWERLYPGAAARVSVLRASPEGTETEKDRDIQTITQTRAAKPPEPLSRKRKKDDPPR